MEPKGLDRSRLYKILRNRTTHLSLQNIDRLSFLSPHFLCSFVISCSLSHSCIWYCCNSLVINSTQQCHFHLQLKMIGERSNLYCKIKCVVYFLKLCREKNISSENSFSCYHEVVKILLQVDSKAILVLQSSTCVLP